MATKKSEKKETTKKPATRRSSGGTAAAKKPGSSGTKAEKPAARRPATDRAGHRDPTPAEIERRAYEIWEAKGRPAGTEAENWAQAERELRGRG